MCDDALEAIMMPDVLGVVLGELRLGDVYRLKRASRGVGAAVSSCLSTLRHHRDMFWGISAHNLRSVCRDMRALAYTPLVVGKMNRAEFADLIDVFAPAHFALNGRRVWPAVYASVLRLVPECIRCLHLTVGQADVRHLRAMGGCVLQSMWIDTKDGITLYLATDLLRTSGCSIGELKLTGTINSMSSLYRNLPANMSRLHVSPIVGVHETRSLRLFLELELDDLTLTNCYEVCDSARCVNYPCISHRIRDSRRLPRRLAMSPFPLLGIKVATARSCAVNHAESAFFEHEMADVDAFFL